MAIKRPENAKHFGLRARGVPNNPPPILSYYLVCGKNKQMSGGRSTFFGLRDSAGGGRPGAADQSDLLKALKLQAILKSANSGSKNVNTRLHTESAIQRSIFYNPV